MHYDHSLQPHREGAKDIKKPVTRGEEDSLPRLPIILQAGCEVGLKEQHGGVRAQRFPGARIVCEAQEAADDVFEQAHAGRLLQGLHQRHQALLHRKEALRGVAHIVQPHLRITSAVRSSK